MSVSESAFINAALNGNLDTVNQAIAQGLNINCNDVSHVVDEAATEPPIIPSPPLIRITPLFAPFTPISRHPHTATAAITLPPLAPSVRTSYPPLSLRTPSLLSPLSRLGRD